MEAMNALDKQFGLTEAGTTVNTEIRAGVTTFLTMAYILLVNPAMLTLAIGDGTDAGNAQAFADILFATALASFVGCIVMGLWANLPFALAPGMGLNAYFTFTVVNFGMGIAWELALFAVFVEGLLFLMMSMPQIPVIGTWRSKMINSIPTDLKVATGAGIGMFLAIIGLSEMGWVVDHPATLVDIGPHATWTFGEGALWGLIGLLLIGVLMARKQKGAIMIGILVVSVAGWGLGVHDSYLDYTDDDGNVVAVNAEAPTEIFSMPSLPEETLFAALGALGDVGGEGVPLGTFLLIMIAFFFVDIFDTAGTLYGVGRMAGKVDENDVLENADEAFMSDAAGTVVGSLAGTSTVTTYIESAAGIEEGGRTGLTAVTVGVLMLTGLFFAGLFKAIPTFAVAPALIVVGAMMMRGVVDINWKNMEVAIPAFLTIVLMPFTYSIADGIAWGVISWVVIKIGVGKAEEVLENRILMGIAILMAMFYLGPGDQTTFDWILGFLN